MTKLENDEAKFLDSYPVLYTQYPQINKMFTIPYLATRFLKQYFIFVNEIISIDNLGETES